MPIISQKKMQKSNTAAAVWSVPHTFCGAVDLLFSIDYFCKTPDIAANFVNRGNMPWQHACHVSDGRCLKAARATPKASRQESAGP